MSYENIITFFNLNAKILNNSHFKTEIILHKLYISECTSKSTLMMILLGIISKIKMQCSFE